MSASNHYKYTAESSYEPAYEVIYDWEIIFSDLNDDDDFDEDEEEEEEEFTPELLLPGREELGEA